MMQRDDTVYLREILDCIAQIEEYTRGVSYETFCAERMRQDAVVKQVENIGEAARKLSQKTFSSPVAANHQHASSNCSRVFQS